MRAGPRLPALALSGGEVRSGVDGGVETHLSGRHLTTLAAEPRDQDLLLVAETSQSHVRVAAGCAQPHRARQRPWRAPWSVIQGADNVAHELVIDVAAGEQLAIKKIAALYTSRDRAPVRTSEAAVGELGQAGSFDVMPFRRYATRKAPKPFAIAAGTFVPAEWGLTQ